MKLSEKIKLLRTAENLTQPELASKAGIEQSYLSKLENDKGSPSYEIINKIAQAFGLNGMELINSLSQSYIEQKLSHIPEVAAEYASIKRRQEGRLKRRFIYASLLVVLGVGLFFMGHNGVIYPELNHIYVSQGVIKDQETVYQFDPNPIRAIQETPEEASERKIANRSRINVSQISVVEHMGSSFIKPVEGGKRVYEFREYREMDSMPNDMVSTLGVMLIVAGLLMFVYGFKFKSS